MGAHSAASGRWRSGARAGAGSPRVVSALPMLALGALLIAPLGVVAVGTLARPGGVTPSARAGTSASPEVASPVSATAPEPATLVSAVPSATTPRIDGDSPAVHAITEVGGLVVVGGAFSQATDPDGSPTVQRSNLLAFDATTGAVDPDFAPQVDGEVDALAPGPDGRSVLLGGEFRTVDGRPARVARLSLDTGQPVAGFTPPVLDGDVNALVALGGRLLLGGTFSYVDGVPHAGFASIDATTGALDPYLSAQVSGDHGDGTVVAPTGVTSMAVTASGTTLVATGNFTSVDGVARDQIVELTLSRSGAVVNTGWATKAFSSGCTRTAFDSWIRQVAFSPHGSYFVVVSTGGGHIGQLCDSAARFETGARGSNVSPTWVDRTGGDSLYAVAITDAAVYVGGHERWFNNPTGHDRAQPGALPRPGIAALDPLTGLPLAWNPGRNPRGMGVFALLAGPSGLWVGMDTDCVGPSDPGQCTTYVRPRLALFPAGGAVPASTSTAALPGDVVAVGSEPGGVASDAVTATALTGSGATDQPAPSGGGTEWSDARGAVAVGGTVFYAMADGTFHARGFDGETWGGDRVVDPYDDPVWSDIKTGSVDADGDPIYYRGVPPGFYGEIPQVTSLAYSAGRLYYTLAGQQALYWRAFQPDAGVISPTENVVSTFDGSRVAGAFFSGTTLYWAAASDGTLHATAFSGGRPVAGSDTTLSGPGITGRDWRARGLLLLPPRLPAPTAVAATLDGAHPTLRWAQPATADPEATVVIRRARGTVAPATIDDPRGTPVATTTSTTAVDSVTTGATYTYSLWTTDPDGTQSAPATITLTALPAPTVTMPRLASDAGTRLTFPVRWSAGSASTFDVSAATLGATQRTWRAKTTTTSAVFGSTGTPVRPVAGRSYTVSVVARDAYGNRTVAGAAATTEPYDDSVARAATSGWRSVSSSTAWLGTQRTTTTRGARLVATLSGSRFAIVGATSRSSGRFKVYLDGRYMGTVGTWSSSTRARRVLWTSPAVAAGTHTIGVVNLASSGHPRVTVDGYAALPES